MEDPAVPSRGRRRRVVTWLIVIAAIAATVLASTYVGSLDEPSAIVGEVSEGTGGQVCVTGSEAGHPDSRVSICFTQDEQFEGIKSGDCVQVVVVAITLRAHQVTPVGCDSI